MNLHNLFVWINHVSVYHVLYISMCCIICVEWHNAFHMHRGNLEVRCGCMTKIFGKTNMVTKVISQDDFPENGVGR